MDFLIEKGDIKEVDNYYSLFNTTDIKKKTLEACKKLKKQNTNVIKISEISNMIGASPDEIEKYIYPIAKALGLFVDHYNP